MIMIALLGLSLAPWLLRYSDIYTSYIYFNVQKKYSHCLLLNVVFHCLMKGGGLRVIDRRSVVHSVKVLAVSFYRLDLDKVIDLMKCFPCLEKLYVEVTIILSSLHW
jgi:hypothetical protein